MGRWDDKFERHASKWASWKMQEYAQHDRVLPKIIEDKARQNPDHVVFQFRDDPLSLGEFNEAINKTANGLLKLGVKHGDKVAIMLPNCAEFLYPWFALNKIGACEVPVNVALKGQGLSYQMTQSDCVALVADTQYLDRLEGITDDLSDIRNVAFTDSTGHGVPQWQGFENLSFADLMDNSSAAPDVKVHYSDLASILYTSGTTGVSKGVMFSHHYWYDIWAESVKYSRYTEDDVLYTGLPFFHGNAQGITVGPAILADAKAVIVERFSASRLWEDCRRWECTEANYIGGIIPILLKQEENEADSDNPVRLMVGPRQEETNREVPAMTMPATTPSSADPSTNQPGTTSTAGEKSPSDPVTEARGSSHWIENKIDTRAITPPTTAPDLAPVFTRSAREAGSISGPFSGSS